MRSLLLMGAVLAACLSLSGCAGMGEIAQAGPAWQDWRRVCASGRTEGCGVPAAIKRRLKEGDADLLRDFEHWMQADGVPYEVGLKTLKAVMESEGMGFQRTKVPTPDWRYDMDVILASPSPGLRSAHVPATVTHGIEFTREGYTIHSRSPNDSSLNVVGSNDELMEQGFAPRHADGSPRRACPTPRLSKRLPLTFEGTVAESERWVAMWWGRIGLDAQQLCMDWAKKWSYWQHRRLAARSLDGRRILD